MAYKHKIPSPPLDTDWIVRTVHREQVKRSFLYDADNAQNRWKKVELPDDFWRSFSRRNPNIYADYEACLDTGTCRWCKTVNSIVMRDIDAICSSCDYIYSSPPVDSEKSIGKLSDGFLFANVSDNDENYTELLEDWARVIRSLNWIRQAYDRYFAASSDEQGIIFDQEPLPMEPALGIKTAQWLSGQALKEYIIQIIKSESKSKNLWTAALTDTGQLEVEPTNLYGFMLTQIISNLQSGVKWQQCLGPETSRGDACTHDVPVGPKSKRFCSQNCYRKWRRAGGAIRPWMVDTRSTSTKPPSTTTTLKGQLGLDI